MTSAMPLGRCRPFVTGLFAAALAAGCSLSDPGLKPGELGNGGFHFSCDDAVACSKYTGSATQFPDAVALGSTFAVTFTPKSASGLDIHFNEAAPDRGITVSPVSDVFVTRGANGLVALKTGYATINSRDAAGHLVDYIVLRVAKPDALVVYSADQPTTDPVAVDAVQLSLSQGDRKTFRAFAQQNKAGLAGSLQLEWTSTNPLVAEVTSTTGGVATLVPRSTGSAMLVATGGTFTQQVPITVVP
ncbi:MAG: hypothetical protein QOI41_5138 [Myxococcales bacterium]|nr:hypothetical protein [Myxococcales bacterium]